MRVCGNPLDTSCNFSANLKVCQLQKIKEGNQSGQLSRVNAEARPPSFRPQPVFPFTSHSFLFLLRAALGRTSGEGQLWVDGFLRPLLPYLWEDETSVCVPVWTQVRGSGTAFEGLLCSLILPRPPPPVVHTLCRKAF